MTQTLKRAIDRLRALSATEQDRIGQRLLEELSPDDGLASDQPETLADWLDGYIGTFDSSDYIPGGARMSEDTGRKFAEGYDRGAKTGQALILTDTGPLVALLDRGDPAHTVCRDAVIHFPRQPFLTSWPCFTEAMYLPGGAGG